MAALQTTVRKLRKQRHPKSAALDWIESFLKAPEYNADWDVTRTAAFLNLYEAATHVSRKEHPDHVGACVIRHRLGLLKKKSPLLAAAISFIPPRALALLTSELPANSPNFPAIPPAQLAELDPSHNDIDTQCAPPPKPLRSIGTFAHKTPKPARPNSVEHRSR